MREKKMGVTTTGIFVGLFLLSTLGLATNGFASSHHAEYIGECGSLTGWQFNYPKTVERDCSDGSTTTESQDWYKETATGNTCYVVTNEGSCSSSPDRDDIVAEIIWDLIAIKQAEKEERERAASLERSRSRHTERNYGSERTDPLAKWNTSSPGSRMSSAGVAYEPSDLPAWDFNFSVQGVAKKSEMELTPNLGRESDVRSLNLNFTARKENFGILNQLFYSDFKGTGLNDGEDSTAFGLLLMPSYQIFSQEENNFSLILNGFIEISNNKYDVTDNNQTRFVPGIGFKIGTITPVGGFYLSDLFSHDRNLDGDTEITGEKYINFNTMSFNYYLPLTEFFILNTGINQTLTLDMPDDLEDSSTGVSISLDYYGWENYSLGLNYVDTLDGFKDQGITLTLGHNW